MAVTGGIGGDIEFGDLLANDADLLLDALCLVSLALPHESADLLGKLFTLGLQFLFLRFRFTACFVTGEHFIDE